MKKAMAGLGKRQWEVGASQQIIRDAAQILWIVYSYHFAFAVLHIDPPNLLAKAPA
jgi:hypothetical protein